MKRNRVYTYGVYDLLHYGHIRMLKQAKALGKFLIVGIYTDKVAESFKRKPIMTQRERFKNIDELGLADLIVYQNTFSPQKNADKHKADIVAKGQGAGWERGKPIELSCKTKFLKYTRGISTSGLIKRVYDNKQ